MIMVCFYLYSQQKELTFVFSVDIGANFNELEIVVQEIKEKHFEFNTICMQETW